MGNMNNQGKTQKQYKDSAKLAWYGVIGMAILLILMTLLTSCYGTYVLTDSEYSDARETHASVTYYNNQIYWGWNSGYYYYYGKPHYYPWYYYYNTCPPSHYHTATHIVIKNTVNKPRPSWNKPTYKPGGNDSRKVYIKPNKNHNKSKVTIKRRK